MTTQERPKDDRKFLDIAPQQAFAYWLSGYTIAVQTDKSRNTNDVVLIPNRLADKMPNSQHFMDLVEFSVKKIYQNERHVTIKRFLIWTDSKHYFPSWEVTISMLEYMRKFEVHYRELVNESEMRVKHLVLEAYYC